MKELLRTRSGQFTLEESLTLEEIREYAEKGCLEEHIRSIEEVLGDYPAVFCREEADRLLLNGNALKEEDVSGSEKEGWMRMHTSAGRFIGVYQWDPESRSCRPVKMFL